MLRGVAALTLGDVKYTRGVVETERFLVVSVSLCRLGAR